MPEGSQCRQRGKEGHSCSNSCASGVSVKLLRKLAEQHLLNSKIFTVGSFTTVFRRAQVFPQMSPRVLQREQSGGSVQVGRCYSEVSEEAGGRGADHGDPGGGAPRLSHRTRFGVHRDEETGQRLAPIGERSLPHRAAGSPEGARELPQAPGWEEGAGGCRRPGPAVLRPWVPEQLQPNSWGAGRTREAPVLGRRPPNPQGKHPSLLHPHPSPRCGPHRPGRLAGEGPHVRGALLGSDLPI